VTVAVERTSARQTSLPRAHHADGDGQKTGHNPRRARRWLSVAGFPVAGMRVAQIGWGMRRSRVGLPPDFCICWSLSRRRRLAHWVTTFDPSS